MSTRRERRREARQARPEREFLTPMAEQAVDWMLEREYLRKRQILASLKKGTDNG